MVFVQDTSQSFEALFAAMRTNAQELVNQLYKLYNSINFALTAFVDKPVPFRGLGYGRGFPPDAGNPDYCYKRITQLSSDAKVFMSGFDTLSNSPSQSGGDAPENPYEGLLYAVQDPGLAWTDESSDIRFAVVITDDLPHYRGDGQLGLNWWTGNGDQGSVGDGLPHFWDPEFIHSASYYPEDAPAIVPSEKSEADYKTLIDLHDKLSGGSALTPEELTNYNELLSLYGPDTYKDLKDNLGAFEDYPTCHLLEYPSLDLVGSVLNRRRVIPLILFATPAEVSTESEALCVSRGYPLTSSGDLDSFVQCALQIYSEDLRAMGIDLFRIENFTNTVSEFIDAVKTIITEISGDMICDDPTASPTQDCSGTHNDSGNQGKIAGIAIGCATAGAALTGLCTFLICAKPLRITRVVSNRDRSRSIDNSEVVSPTLITEREQTQILRVEDFI